MFCAFQSGSVMDAYLGLVISTDLIQASRITNSHMGFTPPPPLKNNSFTVHYQEVSNLVFYAHSTIAVISGRHYEKG